MKILLFLLWLISPYFQPLIVLRFRKLCCSCFNLYWPITLHCVMATFPIRRSSTSHTFTRSLSSLAFAMWNSFSLRCKCFDIRIVPSIYKHPLCKVSFTFLESFLNLKFVLRFITFVDCSQDICTHILFGLFPLLGSSSCFRIDFHYISIRFSGQISRMHWL